MQAEPPNAAQPKSRRRWFQYSLRTLLIFVTLAGCGFGWLGLKVREARRQEAAVAAIERSGGDVYYEHHRLPSGVVVMSETPAPGPAWVRALLGNEFFRNVYGITFLGTDDKPIFDGDLEPLRDLTNLKYLEIFNTRVTGQGLQHLKGLAQLESLDLHDTRQVTDAALEFLSGLNQLQVLDLMDTQVTDAGLGHLTGLTQLRLLWLYSTHVSDAGVAKLQRALPNCHIYHNSSDGN